MLHSCFVAGTLTLDLPLTPGSSDSVQKLRDVSCTRERLPAETNAQQVRSMCGSGLRHAGTDGGRDPQRPDMSLIQTVLDKLAYFLSAVAFCVNVLYSWLK